MATLFIIREYIQLTLDHADINLSAVPCIEHRYVLLNTRRDLPHAYSRFFNLCHPLFWISRLLLYVNMGASRLRNRHELRFPDSAFCLLATFCPYFNDINGTDEPIFKLFVLNWRFIITEAIYIRFCVECWTEYFVFNGKGRCLQFGVTPFSVIRVSGGYAS